jgi:2-iminobutanoate/2-iminopropanoate deaminase
MAQHRKPVTAVGAPAAVGPYAHAIRAGGLLFCSAQIPVDPESGDLIDEAHDGQTARCPENLAAVCAAAGAELRDAVRLTVYVADPQAFEEVNRAYAGFFPSDPPARTLVGVTALPRGAQVAVDAVVALPA